MFKYNGEPINDMTNIGPIHHMITGDPCFHIGMDGGCGCTCPVYLNGECPEPDELADCQYEYPQCGAEHADYDH
jgi:hypothetical protein